jgi:hypothetical protein
LKLSRALAVTTGLASAVASVVALGTVPAQAATGWARCPANRFCVFSGVNGTGVIAYYTASDANLADSVGPKGMNNNIESVWNRRGSEWGLYNDANYKGGLTLVLVGSKSNIVAKYRNLASSVQDIRAS